MGDQSSSLSTLEGREWINKTDADAEDGDTHKESKTPQMHRHQHASASGGGSAVDGHHDMQPAPEHANEVPALPPWLANYCSAGAKRGKWLSAMTGGRQVPEPHGAVVALFNMLLTISSVPWEFP